VNLTKDNDRNIAVKSMLFSYSKKRESQISKLIVKETEHGAPVSDAVAYVIITSRDVLVGGLHRCCVHADRLHRRRQRVATRSADDIVHGTDTNSLVRRR